MHDSNGMENFTNRVQFLLGYMHQLVGVTPYVVVAQCLLSGYVHGLLVVTSHVVIHTNTHPNRLASRKVTSNIHVQVFVMVRNNWNVIMPCKALHLMVMKIWTVKDVWSPADESLLSWSGVQRTAECFFLSWVEGWMNGQTDDSCEGSWQWQPPVAL